MNIQTVLIDKELSNNFHLEKLECIVTIDSPGESASISVAGTAWFEGKLRIPKITPLHLYLQSPIVQMPSGYQEESAFWYDNVPPATQIISVEAATMREGTTSTRVDLSLDTNRIQADTSFMFALQYSIPIVQNLLHMSLFETEKLYGEMIHGSKNSTLISLAIRSWTVNLYYEDSSLQVVLPRSTSRFKVEHADYQKLAQRLAIKIPEGQKHSYTRCAWGNTNQDPSQAVIIDATVQKIEEQGRATTTQSITDIAQRLELLERRITSIETNVQALWASRYSS